jgi:hypothetical protein
MYYVTVPVASMYKIREGLSQRHLIENQHWHIVAEDTATVRIGVGHPKTVFLIQSLDKPPLDIEGRTGSFVDLF